VEVISIDAETNKRREMFLRKVFGNATDGFFCIAYAPKSKKSFTEEFFRYPQDIPQALELINTVYQGNNVWFCPHLFSRRKRVKETVLLTPSAWSDLDNCAPEELYLEPSVVIESSPGRYAGLWHFDQLVDPEEAESLSQRIAYTHSEQGADRSGWDLTQLLRMPWTYNYKYATTPTVKVIEANQKRYRPSDWDKDYPKVDTFEFGPDIPLPETTGLDADELMEKNRLQMSPTIWRLFQEELTEGQRSEALWKLMMYLFEAGFEAPQVFVVAQEAKCNKYLDRGDAGRQQLWKDVCRAQSTHMQNTSAFAVKDFVEGSLVSDEEREHCLATPTFIERYIEWAKSLGDAAPQYHQAGAFTILSALLSGVVILPTSFGTVKPNLWFMILADTTLTRKSTAMDIATDLLAEIDDDAIMATDGSIEGLLTSLGTRPSRPSIFLRDEFSGLLEMITKKDYYAGMPELLTKLYDGKMQKRLLRKETIEVRDPCLLVFAGGIKNKITGLLTFEHVSSGFMPRFIFITAESDITRVRPLGPPTDWTDSNRSAIIEELKDLYDYYHQTQEFQVKGTDIRMDEPVKFQAKLTPEAWLRYNNLETEMLDVGMHSERPEIMTPVYDRLAKSILKSAVLLACTRQKANPVVVEEQDIVRAAVYGESWRMYVREVMNSVGLGPYERQLHNIINAVNKNPGVTRSTLMQNYHLNARDAGQIFETLEQRGLITRTKNGRAETFYPTEIRFKEQTA
jgi:hypothetical protein